MPTIQFNHDIRTCSTSSSILVNLRLGHTIDINGPSQPPIELRDPSPAWLRAVELGDELQIELKCFIEGIQVPLERACTFPFVSNMLAKLQEVCADTWDELHWPHTHTKVSYGVKHFYPMEECGSGSEQVLRSR